MNIFPIILLVAAVVLFVSMDSPNMRYFYRIRQRKTGATGAVTRITRGTAPGGQKLVQRMA